MKRLIIIVLTLLLLGFAAYLIDQYWIHRYDSLIAAEAARHRVDPGLVWSIIYEETYFSPWKKGRNGEIGLMQVTPAVVREWATETSPPTLQQPQAIDAASLLRQADANVNIGCWYLGKFSDEYRNMPGREARMLAAYNAGDSRVTEWNRPPEGAPPLTEQQFIDRIDIPSTRSYVTSILNRYRRVKSAKGQ
jgi:soluble lytic murein transglycosylase